MAIKHDQRFTNLQPVGFDEESILRDFHALVVKYKLSRDEIDKLSTTYRFTMDRLPIAYQVEEHDFLSPMLSA